MAARVARCLRALKPGVEIRAMGGAQLASEGVELIVDSTRLAVMGIAEVAGVLPALLRARRVLRRAIEDWRPDVLVPIDYPDFNIRLAAWARRRGIPVAWVVSPQVWAWRPTRVRQYSRAVSRMLVLLPFEAGTWRAADVPVQDVGHPLLDLPPAPDRATARALLGLPRDGRVLALLPGSRRSEISRTWPVFAETAARLARGRPDLRMVLPVAPGLDASLFAPGTLPPELLQFAEGGMDLATAACDVALVASGTATLETALVPRPLIVGYRVARSTMAIGRWLADPEFLSRGTYCLPNLVLGRAIVPEFYQERFTPELLAAEAARLLDDQDARLALESELLELRSALGGPGAHARIAQAIVEVASGNR